MRHPFDLSLGELQAIDLDFAEPLTDAEAAQVGGTTIATTLAIGEEGGEWHYPRPYPLPRPKPRPRPVPIDPPEYTTLALGEEGGVTTLALGEEGGTTW